MGTLGKRRLRGVGVRLRALVAVACGLGGWVAGWVDAGAERGLGFAGSGSAAPVQHVHREPFALVWDGERVGDLMLVRRRHPRHGRELYREVRLEETGSVHHLSEVRQARERKCVARERALYPAPGGLRPSSTLLRQVAGGPLECIRTGMGERTLDRLELPGTAHWAGPLEWLECWRAGAPSGSGWMWEPNSGRLDATRWTVRGFGGGPLGLRVVELSDAQGRAGARWWFLGHCWLGGEWQPGGLGVLRLAAAEREPAAAGDAPRF